MTDNKESRIQKEMRTFKKFCIGLIIVEFLFMFVVDHFYMSKLVVDFSK